MIDTACHMIWRNQVLSLLSAGLGHPTLIAVLLAAIAGATPLLCFGATGPEVTSLRVHLPRNATPLVKRAAGILASRVEEFSGARAATSGEAARHVYLTLSPQIGAEGFKIGDRPDGGISIAGNDERGLLFGVGKFLHTSTYSSRGFTPSSWRGVSVPKKPVRGIYLATHFHNYYHEAPIEDISRYVEDLSLWGINAFNVWFGMEEYNGVSDPKAQAVLARLRALLATAKDLGLSTSIVAVVNEGYANSPVELRADDSTVGHKGYHTRMGNRIYNLGPELCPSKPGACELMLGWLEEKFSAFRSLGLDYLWIWPYDSGGCTCPKCTPWGANGFLRLAELEARAYRKAYPKGKVVLSTWYFDRWAEGEWSGITEKFSAQKPDWVDYIMVDDYGGKFPEYPLIHGSPGGLPMLNFPEISMYQHIPWGGFGAIPLPGYLQSLWDVAKAKLSGGFPYSEGIFEDINKVMCAQLYWEPDKPTAQTLREYIAFYFSPGVVEGVSQAMHIMEQDLEREREDKDGITRFILKHPKGAEEALRLIEDANGKLPERVRTSWRWRVVYLRALIDSELVKHEFRVTDKCASAFQELTGIYHAQSARDMIRPPTGLSGVLR